MYFSLYFLFHSRWIQPNNIHNIWGVICNFCLFSNIEGEEYCSRRIGFKDFLKSTCVSEIVLYIFGMFIYFYGLFQWLYRSDRELYLFLPFLWIFNQNFYQYYFLLINLHSLWVKGLKMSNKIIDFFHIFETRNERWLLWRPSTIWSSSIKRNSVRNF